MAGGLNLYGYAGGDPINHSDPFGLTQCPPACDGWGAVRSAVVSEFAPLINFAAKFDVGTSGTAGMVKFSQSARTREITAEVGARFPSLGASFDVRFENQQAPRDATRFGVGFGVGENMGIGLNFALGRQGWMFLGAEANAGFSTPTPRVLPSVEAGTANLSTGANSSPLCGGPCARPKSQR